MIMEDTENLYVVKRTLVDTKPLGREPRYEVALPASFTKLAGAKEYARNALKQEGYDVELLQVYEINTDPSSWKHGDGVFVHAEGVDGEVIEVSIDTARSFSGEKVSEDGRVSKPIFHVLQTLIDYDDDRSGGKRQSVIERTFKTRDEATKYAKTVLLDEDVKKEDFVEYDEFANGGDWTFGEDVIVHAVKDGGQNILVAVVEET